MLLWHPDIIRLTTYKQQTKFMLIGHEENQIFGLDSPILQESKPHDFTEFC